MTTFGISIAVIALLGVAAIFYGRNSVLRRWVIYLYCFLMAFVGFGIFMAAPRMAMARLESTGGTWSQEAARGALVMHDVYMGLGGTLLLIATVLAVLALRPPK